MSLIPAPIPIGATGSQVTSLQLGLNALGFPIPPNESGSAQTNGTFGPGTQNAVSAFHQEWVLPMAPPNATPFDAAAAHLLNAVVPANRTASAFLATTVRESWPLHKARRRLRSNGSHGTPLSRETPGPRARPQPWRLSDTFITTGDCFPTPHPELQNPENYYTCRYDLARPVVLHVDFASWRRRFYQQLASDRVRAVNSVKSAHLWRSSVRRRRAKRRSANNETARQGDSAWQH
jgi:peptidoglycan hydrolase-like protein with peptidoglycan-binding domain